MTMLDTLFGLIPAASRGQQWLAEDLQLVNWGGYDGAHRIRFSPTATLLCGGSGSGKSTLMDANVALMMPHTTPFNGASNGAVVGRPRGHEQRNILSYGRGKIDETRTDDGTKLTVLRGDGTDTWTAVAMTWRDHDDSRFTAVRAWYIPAGARIVDDTVKVRGTIHGAFDLSRLESAALQHFTDTAVRATGLDTLPTDREFSARLHAVLGIGAAGAGSKALSLLARIQAGQQITTVDDLYKRMVLEEPETLATADAVVAHFDGLESTRTRMLVARQQVRALEPIRGLRTRIEEAADRLRMLDALGRFTDPDALVTLWRAGRRLELLRDVEAELGTREREVVAVIREKQAIADAVEAEREGLEEVLRSAGGDRLETAHRELRALDRRLTAVQRDRARLDAALEPLAEELGLEQPLTGEAFAALADRARRALSDPRAKESAREAYVAAMSAKNTAATTRDRLKAELADTSSRTDSIPPRLHESRRLLAEAAGLKPENLPFVGELVEVRTEFEPWREAFNLALGGFARTLLIDADDLPAFRNAIDSVRTPERLSYEGVRTGLPETSSLDPRTLPGRLDYRSTPFTGWLQDRLENQFGFVCVERASELSGHRMALTAAGQSTNGSRGAHGGQGRTNLLGFSNQAGLAQLSAELDDAERRLAEATAAAARAAGALDTLDATHAAFDKVTDLSWEQVDVAGVEREQQRWQAIIGEVTSGNPEIAKLQARITEARAKAARLREEIGGAKAEQQQLSERWADVTDEVDAAQSVLDRADDSGRALTPAQAAYLDAQFAAPESTGPSARAVTLARFDAALDSASKRLTDEQLLAQQTLVEQREALRRTLVTFLDRWPNLNLLPDPDTSLGDFERILADLETSGLHELEREWRDSLLELSGNDLANLDSVLSRSLREIRERIEPINRIMHDLPFFDDEHRLQISPRENQSEARRRFRRELREVRALLDQASSDDEREQVYTRMAKLINRMRRTAPDFADLIDVRNHVRVSAERIRADSGQHVALYDHIGEKSGGESQELIAFIVGAALRYQLGDAGAERPRYAPVFLDEALIKADAHFTARAIGAWRGLGFQLVIGAPNDKYSAIEPHVDVEYDILKDTTGRSWAKPKVALPA
ncbi:SbcC/MukB-like Walker B domain-containing protein [Herbiconiux sp. KACC 21604]|uniref:ATP-binding protein n=1 Tax=unclassified Herbiconiux TaxID=2618217 RepID=UPI00149206B8|nr:SbcC/MukB-like Walker B domain-containing protein [Herbiconiux sp. SALV-R1]QJU53088.1 AAA family ATPase [Herbiconiux sp. SALV-R1]WPO88023.1 SbcC/MukB-like Walker B domain-containing protein [Herbiconiux sp. KACC 21604]